MLEQRWNNYIKRLESFQTKKEKNANFSIDEKFDCISKPQNAELYDVLLNKIHMWPFSKYPKIPLELIANGKEKFEYAAIEEQVRCLLNIIRLLGSEKYGADLRLLGGAATSGTSKVSVRLSGWKKRYTDVRIIDQSASGLFERRGENLLELL